MIKKLLITSILSYIMVQPVSAKSVDTQKIMYDLGYTSVYDAVEESNLYFGQKISLPDRIPPVPFTHVFGRLNKSEVKGEGSLEIEYLYEDYSPYRITVLKNQDKDLFSTLESSKMYTLSNGSKAFYENSPVSGSPHRHYFYFKNRGLYYVISIHPNVAKQITTDVLVEIANSVNKW